MTSPFDDSDLELGGDSRAFEPMDLPQSLAETQRRLEQLRPRQPQLDLAMIERLADANASLAIPIRAGVSKTQFAYAVAGSWLCGVAVGAALLFFVGRGAPDSAALDPMTASHDGVAARSAGADAMSASGSAAVGSEMPQTLSASTIFSQPDAASITPESDRNIRAPDPPRIPAAAGPDWDSSLVAALLEERQHGFRFTGGRSDDPLRVTSLRRWPGQRSPLTSQSAPRIVSATSQGVGDRARDGLSEPSMGKPTAKEAAMPNLDAVTPATPMTRQRLLDELLARPMAALL